MVNYNDAYGHPVTKAIVPRGAPAAEVDTFMTNLRDISLRTRSTLVCKTPHNLDGSKFDFTYEHPGGTEGTAAFERQIDLANKAKAIVLKGQSLTTDVSSPGLALGDARQQVEQRLFRGDAEGLATTLRRDVCRPWARWNFRKVSLAPWPSWDTSPPADKLNETQAAVSAAQAIVALQAALKGTGRRLNVLAFLEQQGLPLEDDPGPVAATPPLTEVST
jgi:phage gp29-like protein